MNAMPHKWDSRWPVLEGDVRASIILICSTLLVTVHRFFGSLDFAYETFQLGRGMLASLFMFGAAFLLMGVIPLVLITFVFKERAKMFGLCLGNWKEGSLTVILLLPPITLLFLFPASNNSEILEVFPFAPEALDSVGDFAVLQISRGVLFYAPWEFFFRGFVLFGLRKHVGDWMAICIQMTPQCLWHIGMPTGEAFSSIASGILFGAMAIRTGSIVWPLTLHFAIGVSLDLLIAIQQ